MLKRISIGNTTILFSLSLCPRSHRYFHSLKTIAEPFNRCCCFWHCHCCSRYWLQKSQAIMGLFVCVCVQYTKFIQTNSCHIYQYARTSRGSFRTLWKSKKQIYEFHKPSASIYRYTPFCSRPYDLIRLVGEFRYWRLVVGTNWSFMFGPGIFVMFQFCIGWQAFARWNRCEMCISVYTNSVCVSMHTLCMKLICSHLEHSFGVHSLFHSFKSTCSFCFQFARHHKNLPFSMGKIVCH